MDLPYSHVINYLKILDLVFEEDVAQMCWSILNDACVICLAAVCLTPRQPRGSWPVGAVLVLADRESWLTTVACSLRCTPFTRLTPSHAPLSSSPPASFASHYRQTGTSSSMWNTTTSGPAAGWSCGCGRTGDSPLLEVQCGARQRPRMRGGRGRIGGGGHGY